MLYRQADGSFGASRFCITWTEAIDERMKSLVQEGKSAAQIGAKVGEEFGVWPTRCAVIGRIRRRDLGQLAGTKPSAQSTAMVPRKRASTKKFTPRIVKAEVPRTDITDDLAIPETQRCTILQLVEGKCRWPIGDPCKEDFFFCGGDAEKGRPYCAVHCRRAFDHRPAVRTDKHIPDFYKKRGMWVVQKTA